MPNFNAEIITIGDELLYGQTINTNAAFIGSLLSEIGVSVLKMTTVSDQNNEIKKAIQIAEQSSQIILITGGLGPTNDDVTKKALVEYFNTKLIQNQSVLEDLKELFQFRPAIKIEENLNQTWVPENCIKLTNKVGTAPGMWFNEKGIIYVAMPGVPREMEFIMKNGVLPKLKNELQLPIIQHSIINTVGIAEVKLAQMIAEVENSLPNSISLAYLPSLGKVKLRLTAKGTDKTFIEKELKKFTSQIESIASDYIYGYGNISLEEVVGKQIAAKNFTISTAESCTGGKLANTLLTIPGSSEYFSAGVIAYSYEAKNNLLGVSLEMLNIEGAVSEKCAKEMAIGVREKFNTSIGISSTGIAGPGGGTPDKPVGTVWIAYSDAFQTIVKRLDLGNNGRLVNIELTTIACLNLIRKSLK